MVGAPEQLYMGLSRARSPLVIVGDPDLIAEGGGRELGAALARTMHSVLGAGITDEAAVLRTQVQCNFTRSAYAARWWLSFARETHPAAMTCPPTGRRTASVPLGAS